MRAMILLLVLVSAVGNERRCAADELTGNGMQPEPAVPALLRLFDKYQVVGLSDLHGCAELLGFLEEAVQSPQFAAAVNDLTWEPGNVRYQETMDDFILRLRDVPYAELCRCWRDNTQVHTYSDTPALYHLLETVRNANRKFPAERRVRVLLVDPPVDWSKINSKHDVRAEDFDRETHMAQVLEREVYGRNRKALFFAGGAHLSRSGASSPEKRLVSPLAALERRHPETTFAIGLYEGFGSRTKELEARLQSWPKPALARLAGTWWGELQPAGDGGDIFIGKDGKRIVPNASGKRQDRWDAILFLGRRAELTRVEPPGKDVLDAAWLEELKRRKGIFGGLASGSGLAPKPHSRQYFSDEAP